MYQKTHIFIIECLVLLVKLNQSYTEETEMR